MQMSKISNYYELDPSQNTFQDVMIDITHRCNMTCKNCYIPNREIPDMDLTKMLEAISLFPKRTMIRIVGAEPTMRNDLDTIIREIKALGHRVTLLTNGLRLARPAYVTKLKNAGLRHCYLSMNGVDNDDWYEAIDELRCAEKKIAALKNLSEQRFIIDVGTIIVKGINDTAIGRLLNLYKQINIDHSLIRIKTIGQIGRNMDVDNYTLNDIIDLTAEQTGLTTEYINSWKDRPIYQNSIIEPSTFIFPLDPKSEGRPMHRSGHWIKITDWNVNDEGVPSAGSLRRGRLTENFKVAPFFEHIKMNEGGY